MRNERPRKPPKIVSFAKIENILIFMQVIHGKVPVIKIKSGALTTGSCSATSQTVAFLEQEEF